MQPPSGRFEVGGILLVGAILAALGAAFLFLLSVGFGAFAAGMVPPLSTFKDSAGAAPPMPEITCRFADCHVFRIAPDGTDEWLVLKRAPHLMLGGAWAPVQGHIEPGETAYETAYRELREETGLVPDAFFQASYVNRFYLAQTDQIILSPVFCAKVPHGMPVVLDDEHTEFHWADVTEAMKRYVWPGQRKSLKICREQFVLHEPRAESRIDHLIAGL